MEEDLWLISARLQIGMQVPGLVLEVVDLDHRSLHLPSLILFIGLLLTLHYDIFSLFLVRSTQIEYKYI